MPTTITRSIGTAGGRDYSTLQAWEDAAPASLVTADQIWRGECYADSEFVGSGTRLTISGSTSDATRYKELTVAAGQSFRDHASPALRYDYTKGVGLRNTSNYSPGITVNESYARVSRIQVSSFGVYAIDNNDGATVAIQIESVIASNTATPVRLRRGTIKNSLAVSLGTGYGITFEYSSSCAAINCTVVRPTNVAANNSGFAAAAGGNTLINCAVFGFTSEVDVSSRYTASNCRTDKASPMTGFSTVAYDTSTGSGFESITGNTAHDYRLKSTSALINAGTSTGAPAADIFGTTRPSGAAYDVGAHEYVSAATFKAFWARNSNVLLGVGAT